MDAVNVERVLTSWPLADPWIIEQVRAGANNLSYSIIPPSGRYFLRVYQNTANPARVRYEHAILIRLAEAGVSFAVPAPLPDRSGAKLVAIGEDADRQLAA